MSFDWLDPLGLRGSRLDPFTHLADALLGRGITADSAARMSTAIARRLEGRRVEVGSRPPVSATVERLHDVRPPAGLGALPTDAAELPLFASVAGRVRDVEIGDVRLDRIDLTVQRVRVGPAGDRLRVGAVDYEARATAAAVFDRIASADGSAPRFRVDRGRLEASRGILARWVWVECAVSAADGRIVVEPVTVRVRGRPIPVPAVLLRPIVRPAPRLPAAVIVDSVDVVDADIVVRGRVREVVLPVDVTRVLADLGTQTTRSALRVVFGDR